DSVIHRRMVFAPCFLHQRRCVFGASGSIQKESPGWILNFAAVGNGSQDVALFEKLFLRELVGIVEDYGDMLAAAHRQRLASGEVACPNTGTGRAQALTPMPYMPAFRRSRRLDFENEKRLLFMTALPN